MIALPASPIMRVIEVGVPLLVIGMIILGFVALLRCDQKDIPAVMQELRRWWRWRRLTP
jgi:Ni,Fe-hydrogenase I cytochrome b subunit